MGNLSSMNRGLQEDRFGLSNLLLAVAENMKHEHADSYYEKRNRVAELLNQQERSISYDRVYIST